MLPTILLITEPDEAEALARVLAARPGVRVRGPGDLAEGASPREYLAAEQPAVLILGTGRLGVDAGAYLDAAQSGGGTAVLLVCDPGFTERAGSLRPQGILVRPVEPAALLGALDDLLPIDLPSSRRVIVDPSLYDPASEPMLRLDDLPQAEHFLRLDDMLPDALALMAEPLTPPRSGTVSGQFQQVPLPGPPEPAAPDSAAAPSGAPKVAVDPSLYHDALAEIDVDALGVETSPLPASVPPPARAGRAPPAPPPLPEEASRPRRRTEPPGRIERRAPPPVPREAQRPAPPRPPKPQPPATLPPEGTLAESDPPTLVGWLCGTGYSGCLQLRREGEGEGAERCLYFEAGEVVAASSTLAVDSPPELLYHEGRLSREQLKRARQLLDAAPEVRSRGNRRVAQLLCDEHLLPRAEVAPLLRRQVIEVFYRTLSWERGRYRLLPAAAPAEDRVRLKETPRLLLLEGLRRKASLDYLVQRVGPPATVLEPIGPGALLLKDAGVTAFEQRALPLFDGQHTLQQICQQSGLAEHATYVLAYALVCLGGLRRPVPAPALPAPDPVARLEAARARVHGKHRQVEEGDYFTLLEVGPEAGEEDLRRAYEALREEFSPARLPAACRAELRGELEQIDVVLLEAYAVLSDEAMRSAYRAHLLPGTDEGPSGPL